MASLLHQHTLLDVLTTQLKPTMRYWYLGLLGGLVGIPIGFFPTFAEGRANYSLSGALRTGLLGALLGGLSGIISLPLAEWVHLYLGGGLQGRVGGWVLLGVIIGGCIGIAESRIGGARAWCSVVGGIFGGATAGVLLERLLSNRADNVQGQQAASLGERVALEGQTVLGGQAAWSDSGIWALLLLGLFIALFIALFVNIFADARLEGLAGKVHGHVYYLDKFREPAQAILGSDRTPQNTFIYIPDAQPIHAGITLTTRGALLRHLSDKGRTLVGNSTTSLTSVKERILRDGEIIEVGSARLIYRERRQATSTPSSPAKPKQGSA